MGPFDVAARPFRDVVVQGEKHTILSQRRTGESLSLNAVAACPVCDVAVQVKRQIGIAVTV